MIHEGMTIRDRFDLFQEQAEKFINGDELAMDPFEFEWLMEMADKYLPKGRTNLGLTREDWESMAELNLSVKAVRQRVYRGKSPYEAAREPINIYTHKYWRKIAEENGISPGAFHYSVYGKGMTYQEAAGVEND